MRGEKTKGLSREYQSVEIDKIRLIREIRGRMSPKGLQQKCILYGI